VLQYARERFLDIDTIHILSDGPATQYRNKKNFFLIAHYLSDMIPGIKLATWNFSEAGHGKGAPDGIGAVLKRTADRVVAQGKDVHNFVSFVHELEKNVHGVKLITVFGSDIVQFDDILLDAPIHPFIGTMKVSRYYSSSFIHT